MSSDFIEVEVYLSTRFHSDELVSEYATDISYFKKRPANLQRINSDTGFCSGVSRLFGAQGSPSSGSLLNL